ncbi:hypothetical protein Tco_1180736, partial [Tanacetum coccineum]
MTTILTTIITNFGSPMKTDDDVTYVIIGLSDKYDHVAGIIAHRDPFLDIKTVRSMVITKEMRLKAKSQAPTSDSLSSTLVVLLAEGSKPSRLRACRDNRTSQRAFEPKVVVKNK